MSDETLARSRPFKVVPCALGLVFVLSWAAPRSARAQEPANTERAQLLFSEGRTLMQANQFSEACAKFAESEALDPGGGTILNLGICRRREGRSATAFKLLSLALNRARADGRSDRVTTAQKYLAELGPELSRLTVRLTMPVAPEGLSLQLDGEPFALSRIGEAIALDPGAHRLQASQPGCAPWSAELSLDPVADAKTITVPQLVPDAPNAIGPPPPVVQVAPAPQPAPPPPSPSPSPQAGQRAPNWLGIGLVSAGAVALGAGTYFGLHALTLRDRSDANFVAGYCTTQGCQDDWQSAKTSALLCDVGLGVGIAALAAGSYILLRPAPSAARGALTLSVAASGANARALLKGEF